MTTQFNQLNNKKKDSEVKIDALKKRGDKEAIRKEKIFLDKIIIKENNLFEAGKDLKREYKLIISKIPDLQKSVEKTEKEVNSDILELEDQKRSIQEWFGRNKNIQNVTINGPLISGTKISGPNDSIEINEDFENIKNLKKNLDSDPDQWEISIEKIKK